jgi:serine/threonine-protein kinase
VVLTAVGSVDTAVEAMKSGAFEFLEKPVNAERLGKVIEAAMTQGTSGTGSLGISVVVTPSRPVDEAAVDPRRAVTARRPAVRSRGEDSGPAQRIGRAVGRYEVVERIGRGGMGEVFRCRDPLIGRQVAVKVLYASAGHPAHDAEMQARFKREAAATGTLAHPGIVGVYDFGRDEELGLWFIVLEFVEGQGLNLMLAEHGRLPVSEVVPLGFQLADALAFAHAHGVVHRDIKPSNVLVRRDGVAKLVDFGLAAVEGWEVTMAGRVFGSPSYMAPERIQGKAGGPAADQFSLGVVLYETLSGANPFAAPTPEARLLRILHDDPPPIGQVVEDVPEDLAQLVARLMSRDETERFSATDELAERLLLLGARLGMRLTRFIDSVPTPLR